VVSGEAGVGVDPAEEARVRLDVVDALGLAAAQHQAGDAAVGRQAQLEQAGEHGRIVLGHERKVELVLLLVEQQDRRAHRVEHLAALGDHEREQLVEVDARRERAREVVEQPEPRRAFGRHTIPVERHGVPICPCSEPAALQQRGERSSRVAAGVSPAAPPLAARRRAPRVRRPGRPPPLQSGNRALKAAI